MSAKEGTVFILTNDAMPGFVRFDYTTKDDLAARIERVNRAELPIPYRLNFAAKVPDCELVERNVRFLFSDYSEGADSNFYKMAPDHFRAAIELAATEIVELDDEEIGIGSRERAKMDQMRAYHDAVWFEALNAEAGTTLRFTKNAALKCTAIGNGMVEFDGTVATPAEASIKAMQASGFDWSEVSATEYWVPEAEGLDGAGGSGSDQSVHTVLKAANAARERENASPVMFVKNNKI